MRIRIRLPRRSDVALRRLGAQLVVLPLVLVSVLWGQLAGPTEDVGTTRALSIARGFYLTTQLVPAGEAGDACAAGYHFASIWEILDPSALTYDQARGLPSPDSGSGPPTAINVLGAYPTVGWIRTGYVSGASEPVGQANCYSWLSSNSMSWGTTAVLPNDWTSGGQDLGVWDVGVRTCNTQLWVWCVQDDPIFADGFEEGDTGAWSAQQP